MRVVNCVLQDILEVAKASFDISDFEREVGKRTKADTTEANIRKMLNAQKVVELRSKLEKLGKDTAGLKGILVARLVAATMESLGVSDQSPEHAAPKPKPKRKPKPKPKAKAVRKSERKRRRICKPNPKPKPKHHDNSDSDSDSDSDSEYTDCD